MAKLPSDIWMGALRQTTKNQPKVVPEVGVTITCRIVVSSFEHWQLIQDTLDACRQFGTAEITDYQEFKT